MSSPSILLVPGSFALPHLYQPIFDAITDADYEIRGLHLPSVGLSSLQGRNGPPPTMYDDAAFIAKEAEKLADEGKIVIVIGHSYGGIPVSQCSKGLDKEERKQRGKLGGIVRLAYITALVPAIGKSAKDVLDEVPKENQAHTAIDENGWMLHDDPAGTARIIMQTISPEEGEVMVKQFAKHSAISFVNELTYAGYKDVPVSYLLCGKDLCIPPIVQRAGINMIEHESGRKVDVTRIDADHCPNHTAEKETIDWILNMAKRVEGEQDATQDVQSSVA